MRILVTGAAGRLGQPLVRRLALSHEIVAFDRQAAPADLPANVRYVQADLRDLGALQAAAADISAAVHLGAIAGRMDHLPRTELYDINVQGTFNVLEAVRGAGGSLVVLASSLCAIGLPDALERHGLSYLPVDEDHPCRPRHTYDLTKRINEITAETFTRLTGISTICLRFPTLIDVRRDPHFAKWVRQAPTFFTLGDYLDIQDAVTVVELALERGDLGHEVFFAHAPTLGVSSPAAEHLKRFVPPVEWRGPPPDGTTPFIRTEKIRRILGFEAKIAWQDGMADDAERTARS